MILSRRKFIKTSAALGAVSILPAHIALGKQSGSVPPSERINLAVIGIGNQGNSDRTNLVNSGHCNVVALCDIDLEGAHTLEAREAHPDAPKFTDFRKMFDQMADQIDAVLIATPDHSHFCATMHAMSLGKHVFVEKPLAHTFGQCELMMRLAKRSGVVTQMGNQGHSGHNYFQFKAWSEAGIIKDVTKVTANMNMGRRWHGWGESVTQFPSDKMPGHIDWESWASSAPVHPYSQKLHPQEWRSWFDYGCGAFGDWGPHILDTTHRFLKLGLPTRVSALRLDGRNSLVYPQASTIEFSFPEREGMPPCVVTWYDGQKNRPTIEPEYGVENSASSEKFVGRFWLR